MQVLCKVSDTVSDVRCKVCGQGFLVYWFRTSKTEREVTRRHVAEALANQHANSNSGDVHPAPVSTFRTGPDIRGSQLRLCWAARNSGRCNLFQYSGFP